MARPAAASPLAARRSPTRVRVFHFTSVTSHTATASAPNTAAGPYSRQRTASCTPGSFTMPAVPPNTYQVRTRRPTGHASAVTPPASRPRWSARKPNATTSEPDSPPRPVRRNSRRCCRWRNSDGGPLGRSVS